MSTAESCTASAGSLTRGNMVAAEGIASLVEAAESDASSLAFQGGEHVEGLATKVRNLESSHASSLGLLVGNIEEHVEEACAVREPSGGTPGKKAYPRPSKFRYGRGSSGGDGAYLSMGSRLTEELIFVLEGSSGKLVRENHSVGLPTAGVLKCD